MTVYYQGPELREPSPQGSTQPSTWEPASAPAGLPPSHSSCDSGQSLGTGPAGRLRSMAILLGEKTSESVRPLLTALTMKDTVAGILGNPEGRTGATGPGGKAGRQVGQTQACTDPCVCKDLAATWMWLL